MIHGWVDLQVNGINGIDFSGYDLTVERVEQVSKALLEKGTIAYCPTIITSPMDIYERNLPIIAKAMQTKKGAEILGIHVEGPFLNPFNGYRGFHPKIHIKPPSIDLYKNFQKWANDQISIISLAPEQEGAFELIEYILEESDTIISMAHHNSSRDIIKKAVDKGVKAATHVGNGLTKKIPRFDNPLWPILAEDRLTGFFITDGFHIPDDMILTCLRAKGISKFIVTSDIVHYAGMKAGNYVFHDGPVVLEPNGLLHRKGCIQLAGSTSTMLECINHLASLGELNEVELYKVGHDNQLSLLGKKINKKRLERAPKINFKKNQFFLES